ncbi:putative Morphogenesis-related protein MSB1 [Glarea lozoyensis 74030]|uniref:Putative Morphogenesis-related protein MSB1 n=1 Tax=Glarea lozoyensis (strain ATCC 74030 / MF5533) TaxID=1104152 RepID=H0EGN9_GLAL7|nr:putative Morphogenesis-related protein MSB1 [Glarea lozoyensis 74030]
MDEVEEDDDESNFLRKPRTMGGLRSTPHQRNVGLARPTTPSWADFLNVGFVDEAKNGPAPLLLPPDKILPPINTRANSSQSHAPRLEANAHLEPGELASITRFDLDDSFWWVWISSLAGEETPERKAAFGRCALIETVIRSGRWLVMEEMVKGAAPEPEEGAYIAEKKSFWGRSKKSKNTRRKSMSKDALDSNPNMRPHMRTSQTEGYSKTSIGPDQHARIQAAAIQLQQRQRQIEEEQQRGTRRGRKDNDMMSTKTSSVFTLQPVIMSEASPAMKWANKYDKDAIREAYLKNANHGRGLADATIQRSDSNSPIDGTLLAAQREQRAASTERDLPAPPPEERPTVPSKTPTPPQASLPPTPRVYNEENTPISEKQMEIPQPIEHHPSERGSPMISPMSPPPPPVKQSMDIPRPSHDQSGSSPESKMHNKLKKKEVGSGGGGFKKMFGGRKKEKSMPPSVSQNGNQGNLAPPASSGGGLGRRLSNLRKKPVPVAAAPAPPPVHISQQHISEDEITPVATPHNAQPQQFERSYDPSLQETLSRVDTGDAQEAQHAFSRFDQGPLEDVPAFVPDDSPRVSEDDAAPPPISMSRQSDDGNDLTKQVSPTQDRWAQIRKNAAERAAARQSEEQSRGGYSQKTDGDDGETSGEESICLECLNLCELILYPA